MCSLKFKRVVMGCDGEDDTPAEPATPPPAIATTGPSEAEKLLMKEVETLKTRGTEMEALLLDDSYADFLASKKEIGNKEQGVKLDDMTNAELVAYIEKSVGGKIDKGLSRLETNTALDKVKSEMVKLREAHSDFDLYKEEMVAIATENPNLSLKRVYNMAKAETGPRKPKLAPSELPGNEPPGSKPSEIKGFKDQVGEAWKASGLSKILKEVQ